MGDLNSRIGVPTELQSGGEKLVYEGCEDTTVNKNGTCTLQLCEDTEVAVVNNVKYGDYHFKSKLSFRKKTKWISEPDLLLASDTCLQMIESFNMIQCFENKLLYSDHALLEFNLNLEKISISMELLRARANDLGKSICENSPIRIEKSLRLAQCDAVAVSLYFVQNIPPSLHGNENIDTVVNDFNRIVTEVLRDNKEVRDVAPSAWGNEERWTRLLHENDQRKIWKSINWDGSIEEIQAASPSDEEFKLHFEQLLNPQSSENEERK